MTFLKRKDSNFNNRLTIDGLKCVVQLVMNPGIQCKQFLANVKLKFFTVIFPSCSLSICFIVKISCLLKYTKFNFTFLELIYHAILWVVNYFWLKLRKMTLSTRRIAPLARFPKRSYCFHFFFSLPPFDVTFSRSKTHSVW